MIVKNLSNSFQPFPKSKKGGGMGNKNNKKTTVTPEAYNIVYKRDKGKCRLCGITQNIQAHHILYRSERKDLINEPTNMIMLCIKCHQLVHSNKKKYQPILLKLIKGE